MTEELEKHTEKRRRWIKWALLAAVLFGMALSVRLLLKSELLFDYGRDLAVERVSEMLNGSIYIDKIRGDLLHGFTIYGTNLADEKEQNIVTIDSISVRYHLMDIIRSPHTVENVSIYGVQSSIAQEADSVWNVLKLLPESEEEEPAGDPVFWGIEDLLVEDLNIDVQSDILLPDGFLNIRNLNLSASGGVKETGYAANIRSLDFQLQEARLPDDIDFVMEARGDNERITLESLVVQTGRSMLRAGAAYETAGELSATAGFAPLSWEEIAVYAEDLPLRQDLNLDLELEGELSNLSVTAILTAPGLDHFSIGANLRALEPMALNRLQIDLNNLNTPLLTGIENAPSLSELNFTGEGEIPLDRFRESDWSGRINFAGLSYDRYQIDTFDSEYELMGDRATVAAFMLRAEERVDVKLSAEQVWGEVPVWSGNVSSGTINLATWTADPGMDSEFRIQSSFSGRGIQPDQMRALAEVLVEGGRFGEQPFSELSFRGNLNSQTITGNLKAQLDRSVVEARMNARQWQEDPDYDFNISMREFNLAELSGLDDFPTYLNGTLEGSGKGISPETLQIDAVAALDSSLVNRSPIETLRTDISIFNQFVTLENALLESPIADADITVRHHITDFTNLENRVNFRAFLKDLQPLAPLVGADHLESEGEVSGELNRSGEGYLVFNGRADLQNTRVDSLFLSNGIGATLQARLLEEPEVDLDLDLSDPIVGGITVRDVKFRTGLKQQGEAATGTFIFEIFNEEICTLHHEGEYRVDNLMARVQTTALDFTTEFRKLSLDRPFDFEFDMASQTARVDTVTIRDASDRSFLSVWAPQLSADIQEAGIIAENLNLGAIQSLMLEEPVAEGFLSGELGFKNDPENLYIALNGEVRGLHYQNETLDLTHFYLNIEEEWLQLVFDGNRNDERLFEGQLQVPYMPGDPTTFNDQFFDREVTGYFELFDSDLSYWFGFLPDFESDQTAGTIRLRSELSGIAGNPELTGNLHLENAQFSGIEINSADFDLNYIHDDEFVDLTGRVIARETPVLDMDARLPFIVDLREAAVLLPDEEDEVSLNFRTENFNLAIFNDFLDDQMFRQLRGQLNGEVTLSGALGDLQTSGSMQLTNGNLWVVPAGITLTEIVSGINFSGERVELQQFRMRSGPGQIRATGFMEMENLTPGNLQLNIHGNQFRAANTAEYNATIDLTADLTGTVDEPTLTGNLTFLNGFVNLQNFGERSVEDVQLEDEEEPEPIEFYEMLEMEMNVNFARQFFIRNRQYLDMEVELGGDVDLVKSRGEELQMFGALEGVRGYARPLGKNFTLDEAFVTFYGPVDDPELNIRTEFQPPQAQSDVSIFYIIEGTVQEPEFRFDSEPPLELQDIISYTLFGKPFYELESWEQVVAGSGSSPSAADLALDVLLDRVELLASQSLGIDVVQIDNTRSGSDSTTSIKTGWYLNRRTFFAVLNEISSSRPKTLFMLEYLLKENLELIVTQGDDSREGIDLRWQYDY
ncbi:translocation/assembly module TamB domain-containing protein [Rhodohalobacter halophilus]|uniref:translocation/assembly module TamB domain-containing protein n=1 Tax=Rhodohalobacter halophilus TaxID=1812810 RepID=UPI00083F5E20|nr:translocation/assembly module TamB domain-containing protein [Rhodohalobacter halophilus]